MNNIKMNTEEINSLFSHIGLANEHGTMYKQRLHKHRQLFDFIQHIEKAIKRLSTKRTLTLVDCACGKSYLSFVANYYLTNVLKRDVEFICIDYNEHVIKQSQEAANKLGFTNMTFICNDIFKTNLNKKIDVIYSLHACDTATDMTIAKGIAENAMYIMTVSCCQHFVRSNMKKHPLGAITKHGVYKERIADMVSDSMRSLALETYGYQPKLFDYVPSSETPKNVMIRATRGPIQGKRYLEAQKEYNQLQKLFNVEPKLYEYIELAQNKRGLSESA